VIVFGLLVLLVLVCWWAKRGCRQGTCKCLSCRIERDFARLMREIEGRK
jgi:hypothetical protein